MSNKLSLGDRVYVTGRPTHLGKVHALGDGHVTIKWGRGYTSTHPTREVKVAHSD